LTTRLGQAVVVENRAGAMNMIGNELVSHSTPDGYTILWGSIDMTMVPMLQKGAASFNATRDLLPVGMAATTAGTYVVNPSFPAKDLKEFIAYARANPGKVRNGITGVGGSLHLTAKILELKTGIELTHVAYRGSSEAIKAVIENEVEMGTFSFSTAAANRGKIKILAQTGATRHPVLADVPTTAELGLPDVSIEFWWGLFVAPNTPKPVVDRLGSVLDAALKEPAIRDRFSSMGVQATYMSPADFSRQVADDQKKWTALIPAMGFKPE
jgi:tripartite-type tricarboxylate transporter receptor subunit TctC